MRMEHGASIVVAILSIVAGLTAIALNIQYGAGMLLAYCLYGICLLFLIAAWTIHASEGRSGRAGESALGGFRRWIDWNIKQLRKMKAGRFSDIEKDRMPWFKCWREETAHGINTAFGNPSALSTEFAEGNRLSSTIKAHEIKNAGLGGAGEALHWSSYPGGWSRFNALLDANIEDLEYLRKTILINEFVSGFTPKDLWPKQEAVWESVKQLFRELKWKIK